MKLLFVVTAFLSGVMVIAGCFGSHRDTRMEKWQRPLYFVRQDGADTADFCHIVWKDRPYSLELLGRYDTLAESTYVIFLQIGTYGSPNFDKLLFALVPESVTVTVGGLGPITTNFVSTTEPKAGPWEAHSIHIFSFHRDSLMARVQDSAALRMEFILDGYVVYNKRPQTMEPIVAFDPWFTRLVEESAEN